MTGSRLPNDAVNEESRSSSSTISRRHRNSARQYRSVLTFSLTLNVVCVIFALPFLYQNWFASEVESHATQWKEYSNYCDNETRSAAATKTNGCTSPSLQHRDHPQPPSPETQSMMQVINNETITYVRSNVIYAHIHLAKTAGTNLNAALAAKYEGVCGHKGYSWDWYQFSVRANEIGNHDVLEAGGEDVVSQIYPKHNRGRVNHQLMKEIGFEACDYISIEQPWREWEVVLPRSTNSSRPLNYEFHVPCREPIEHLMSMCNYYEFEFDCDMDNFMQSVANCTHSIVWIRFSPKLFQLTPIPIKCYDAVPYQPYVDYMGKHLLHRRIEAPFFRRDTNQLRNRTNECIWSRPDLMKKLRKWLIKKVPYFSFCNGCMGTENDLLRTDTET